MLLMQSEFAQSQKIGLVLSGGGARGMAHIGVIKALEEEKIPIDYITGTSAGAIVGFLYSLGFSAEDIDSISQTEDFSNWATGVIDENFTYYFRKYEDNSSWINLKFSLDSLIQTRLPTHLVNSVPFDFALMELSAAVNAKTGYEFDSLFVPFRCVASNVEEKSSVIFKRGNLAEAVRASSAYPFYFKPLLVDGKLLYDGGMYNNFPADIALSEFQPDMIIGVNAAGTIPEVSEDNIFSHLRALMTTPTTFSVICETSVLIDINTDQFGVFDFSKLKEIIQSGYDAAMSEMDRLKFYVHRKADPELLAERREKFRAMREDVKIDRLHIRGINERQAGYVRNVVKPSKNPVPLSRLKSSYFQLVADPNVKAIYPVLEFNDSSGYFDLTLNIERVKDLIVQFGGNLSSRPVSEAFIGLQYNIWRKRAYSLYSNFYFGKLYTSGQVRLRMHTPARIPYYIESDVTLNQYDFFKSSNAFFSDQKPAFIVKSDYNYGFNAGIPVRNKGRFISSASYFQITDNYYQTSNFLQKDTADKSVFKGVTGELNFERNTLNRKQYANQGTRFQMSIRLADARERSIPGSTSIDRSIINDKHTWYVARMLYDNYYKRRGKLKLGFYLEATTSNMPFFVNYISSTLNAPAFEPLTESQTLFLENFRAHQFAGFGLKNVLMLRSNLDLRIEGFVFMPYQELLRTDDGKTEYGSVLSRRYYIATANAVFHSPLGPVSFSVNYYDDRPNPFSVLFHFGYFIFNKSALD